MLMRPTNFGTDTLEILGLRNYIEQGGGFVVVEFSGHTHLLLEISNKFTSMKLVLISFRKVRNNSKIESCLGCI